MKGLDDSYSEFKGYSDLVRIFTMPWDGLELVMIFHDAREVQQVLRALPAETLVDGLPRAEDIPKVGCG